MSAKTKRFLRIHLGLVLAEGICASAFGLELARALSGNGLSWAYVFEWPLFGGYAVYVWRRLVVEERAVETPGRRVATSQEDPEAVPDDPALTAYNAYLDSVHRPSGPPPAP